MISNKQIVDGVKEALAKAFKAWLDENKAEIIQTVSAALRLPAKLTKQPQPLPAETAQDQEYLTPRQLAERWNLCVATVYRRLRNGELPAVRVSRRHLLISAQSVKEFEAAATTGTTGRRR